jgi:hypothetical protein
MDRVLDLIEIKAAFDKEAGRGPMVGAELYGWVPGQVYGMKTLAEEQSRRSRSYDERDARGCRRGGKDVRGSST